MSLQAPLNCKISVNCLRWTGSSFHIFGPTTKNTILPNSVFVRGTSYAPDDTERSVERSSSADVVPGLLIYIPDSDRWLTRASGRTVCTWCGTRLVASKALSSLMSRDHAIQALRQVVRRRSWPFAISLEPMIISCRIADCEGMIVDQSCLFLRAKLGIRRLLEDFASSFACTRD